MGLFGPLLQLQLLLLAVVAHRRCCRWLDDADDVDDGGWRLNDDDEGGSLNITTKQIAGIAVNCQDWPKHRGHDALHVRDAPPGCAGCRQGRLLYKVQ